MKPILGWTLALAVTAGAVGAWSLSRSMAPDSPEAVPAAPVAQVTTELAQERVFRDTLEAFGEVVPGPLVALSFARAGQITHLGALPGDRVSRGTVLVTMALDPTALEAYTQATNTAALARREADRQRQLLALQLATRSAVDAADKAARDAASTVTALDAQGGGAASAALSAPFDGVIVSVAATQGDRVAAGAPILQLVRADDLRVQIGIDPAQRRRVAAGATAVLAPIAGIDDAAPIEAVVSQVQDMTDPKTQLVNAIVNLPRSSAGQLVPGMKVRATLQAGDRSALAVPRNAVLSDAIGDYVYQVSAGKARRIGVTKLFESNGYTAVSGLTDLQLPVVTVGNYELQDGMAVAAAATQGTRP